MMQVTLDEPGRFSRRDDAVLPTQPGPGEAVVRVRRIGVCGTDLHAFAGEQPFFAYPRVLGHELGVEVTAVGDGVANVAVGDRCAVEPYLHCGACIACRRGRTNCCEHLKVLGVHVDGGMRTHLVVPAEKLHRSDALTLDQLALVETLGIGAHAVERGAPAADDAALVIGAGPIGLTVIQFLRAAGCEPMVADLSAHRLAFARETLGVRRTVNAGADDLAAALRDVNDGELPTLVFDATGHPRSMMRTFELAAHGGRIVFVGLFQGEVRFDDPNLHRRELTLLATRNATAATFRYVMAQIEAEQVDTTPWITHRLALDEVVEKFAALREDGALIKAVIEVGYE
ncbi:MAG: zinc-binding alcohol dehydrogenase family protein [Phycisphaeraceae bacterium]